METGEQTRRAAAVALATSSGEGGRHIEIVFHEGHVYFIYFPIFSLSGLGKLLLKRNSVTITVTFG